MDFSEPFRCSGTAEWAPDGKRLAFPADFRLVVRDADTLQVTQLFACSDAINTVSWSPDSQYILAACYKKAVVHVFCVDDPEWSCKIDEGPAGLCYSRWTPDSRHIINTNDFRIRMTVWSLCTRNVAYINSPKFDSAGCCFSHDGQFMAVAERSGCQDSIAVYTTNEWQLAGRFEVGTKDMVNMSWSPDDRALAVWDTPLDYLLVLFSPDGRELHRLHAYNDALGIKTVNWSPSGQFLSVGSYDQKVRVLNTVTWRVMKEHQHVSSVEDTNVAIFQEKDLTGNFPTSRALELAAPIVGRSAYVVVGVPLQLPKLRPNPEKPNPKLGVGMGIWSSDSQYLATRNDNMPSVMWIWDTASLSLTAVIVQLAAIRNAVWDPTSSRLAMCVGSRTIYIWTPDGCSCVESPTDDLKITSLRWNHDGSALVVMDKERVCVCYVANT